MKSLPAAALGMSGSSIASVLPPATVPKAATAQPVADGDADADTVTEERVPLRGAIPADVLHMAQTFLDLPLGAERLVTLHDTDYVFVLEWHYHPRGFVGAPTGWHKGVTVYLTH